MSKRSRSVAGLTVDPGAPAAPPPSLASTKDGRTVVDLCAQIEERCKACSRVFAELDKNAEADYPRHRATLFPDENSTDVQLSVKTVTWSSVLQKWYPGCTRDYKRVDDVFHTGLDFAKEGYRHWKNMITAMRKCSQEYAAFGESPKARHNLKALLHNAVVLEKHLNQQLSHMTSSLAKADLWRSDAHRSAATAEFQEFMKVWAAKYRIEKVVPVVEKPIMMAIRGSVGDAIWFKVKPSTLFRRVAEAYAETCKLSIQLERLRILVSGNRIDLDASLDSAYVGDGDVLDCMVEQYGD